MKSIKPIKPFSFILRLLLLIVMVAPLASCGDDDEKDEPKASENTSGSNGGGSSYESLILGTWSHDQYDHQLVFSAGGTGYSYDGGYKTEPGEDYEIDDFTWYITGNQLVLILSPYDVETYTILKLDNTQLILKDEEYDEVYAYTRVR